MQLNSSPVAYEHVFGVNYSDHYTFLQWIFDAVSFKRLLAEQEVADGIVIGGTTGESPTITFKELRQAIVCAQDFPKKRIVGVGSNNTHETIEKITMLDQMTSY